MDTNAQDEAVETPEVEVTKAPKAVAIVAEAAPKVLKAPVVQTVRTSLFNSPFAPPGK